MKRPHLPALFAIILLTTLISGCETVSGVDRDEGEADTSVPSVSIQETSEPEPEVEAVQEPAPIGSGQILYDMDVTALTGEQENLILIHMDTAWEGLAKLETPDFSGLFSNAIQ